MNELRVAKLLVASGEWQVANGEWRVESSESCLCLSLSAAKLARLPPLIRLYFFYGVFFNWNYWVDGLKGIGHVWGRGCGSSVVLWACRVGTYDLRPL